MYIFCIDIFVELYDLSSIQIAGLDVTYAQNLYLSSFIIARYKLYLV